MSRLKICVDSRLIGGQSGGVEQAIIGLASGLTSLEDGDEAYFFLTYNGFDDWLRPYIQNEGQIISVPPPNLSAINYQNMQRKRLSTWLRRVWDEFGPQIAGSRSIRPVPVSDGTVEKYRFDAIHFPVQRAFRTQIPSIYHPWDLQHIHLPELFSRRARLGRDIVLKQFCQQATIVAVASPWIKADVVRQYRVPAEKVKVIPMAPALAAYEEPNTAQLASTKEKYALPEQFLFYPAQTFKHKNHTGLLHALAALREERGLVIPLVCSGRLNEHFSEIQSTIELLHLGEQVQFIGYVREEELYSLYKLAHAVVFPTQYEGWGFPLTESFIAGVPIACSNVTTLPEQAGDAAILFDPNDRTSMCTALAEVWFDERLRNELIEKGKKRARLYSWDNTARMFRAHYRLIGGCNLNEEDKKLLANQ